jgi:hypothetical protein
MAASFVSCTNEPKNDTDFLTPLGSDSDRDGGRNGLLIDEMRLPACGEAFFCNSALLEEFFK